MKIISSKADQFFKDVPSNMMMKLPTFTGELLLTNHSAGSINSQAYMKRWNRKNEYMANKAEIASVAASYLGLLDYPADRINESWRFVLGGQFHDILPGTCIPKAYEYAWNDELIALNRFSGTLTSATDAVCSAMNTSVSGIPVVVYNPLPIEREDVAEANVIVTGKVPLNLKVYGPDKAEVPSQVLSIKGSKVQILFLAKVPPVSWSVFDVKPAEQDGNKTDELKVTTDFIENSRYLIKISEMGEISSIFDKTLQKELLTEPMRLAFQYERPQHWPAWNMDWADRKKPPSGYVDTRPIIRITERGPVRVALEITREARGSVFIQQIRLCAGGSSPRIEFDTRIDWRTKETSLKATFPLIASNPLAYYNTGLGVVERGNNDSLKFEVPSHEWFDLTDKSGDFGVTVMEDCKYGSDKPADNLLRLTLLYTPGVRNSYKDQGTSDFGKHHFLYGLYSHAGNWSSGGSQQQAMRLNQPLVTFQTASHIGALGNVVSLFRISSADVNLMALKKAEDSDMIILRLNESSGKAQKNVTVSFISSILTASEMNAQEQEISPVSPVDGKLVFDLSPFQPRTFAVRLKAPAHMAEKPVSSTIDLPFNEDVVSSNANMKDGSFNNERKTYPAEMWPKNVIVDGVSYQLGGTADGVKNALGCTGQKINLPEGKFDHLYLLAAAAHENEKGTIIAGGSAIPVSVSPWYGYYGQWDKRLWDGNIKYMDFQWDDISYAGLEPGYVRPDNIAFVTTHTHKPDGKNDAYSYGYVYYYKIDLPEGTKSITLPDNPAISIFAMTAVSGITGLTSPAINLYDTLNYNKKDYIAFTPCKAPVIHCDEPWIKPGKEAEASISCAEKDAVIRYTVDGSEPDSKSPVYSAPLKFKASATLKCMAFKPGMLPSKMVSLDFNGMKVFRMDQNIGRTKKGLNRDYYECKIKTCDEVNKLKPVSSGNTSGLDLSGCRKEYFAVKFTGYLNIPAEGTYTFYLTSDDGSVLSVANDKIIDNDGAHSKTEKLTKCIFGKGNFPFELVMFNGSGDSSLTLEWEGPGFRRCKVPDSAFSRKKQ
ncbi:MAG: PA14 domain-containing protein [Bacteroidia bacterium]|nr:PA14 domain-containing protein [Bacteroidia bacterium]